MNESQIRSACQTGMGPAPHHDVEEVASRLENDAVRFGEMGLIPQNIMTGAQMLRRLSHIHHALEKQIQDQE